MSTFAPAAARRWWHDLQADDTLLDSPLRFGYTITPVLWAMALLPHALGWWEPQVYTLPGAVVVTVATAVLAAVKYVWWAPRARRTASGAAREKALDDMTAIVTAERIVLAGDVRTRVAAALGADEDRVIVSIAYTGDGRVAALIASLDDDDQTLYSAATRTLTEWSGAEWIGEPNTEDASILRVWKAVK